jgi:hypothetical protein
MKQKTIKKLTLAKQTISNLEAIKGGAAPTVVNCGTGCVCPSLKGQQSCGIACTVFDCFPVELALA